MTSTGNLNRVEEGSAQLAAPELGAEAVELLSSLLRIDTSNPPGNELPAQQLLAEMLTSAGCECELLAASDSQRPNLVARLEGRIPGPTLCYLCHVDTVPADPSEWSFDPWAGDVVDGEIRGRGAQDMKDQVAAEAAACASLARSGWRPEAGTLLFVCTADEEMGANAGAKWLCETHPEKVRADMVVNEGGGVAFQHADRRLYPLAVGEKGVFRFLLRTLGRAGHASVPGLGDNALIKLAPLLERLREQPPPLATPAGVAFLEALFGEPLAADGGALADGIARLRRESPPLATMLAEPILSITLVPTQVSASQKENVIPSRAQALIDCRVPPGMGEQDVRETVERLLGPPVDSYELEFVEHVIGNDSPFHSPLADAIGAWVDANDPGATLAPIVMPGFSDSHWWRRAFGSEVTVYGFCPQRDMDAFQAASLVHSADERIKVADVEYAARFFAELAPRVLV